MPKSRLPGSRNKQRRSTVKSSARVVAKTTLKAGPKAVLKAPPKAVLKAPPKAATKTAAKTVNADLFFDRKDHQLHRFVGVSLSGGKSDKSCVAVIDYYPQHKKVFFTRSFEKIKAESAVESADQKLYEILAPFSQDVEAFYFDSPLTLPKCLRCELRCPGYEVCTESEMIWFRDQYERFNKNRKPKRSFTPYTQRASETWCGLNLETEVEWQHSLGSNLAPVTARGAYLSRRLQAPSREVNVRLAVWRLGLSLKIQRGLLARYRTSVDGEEARAAFLKALVEKEGVFIYQQDLRTLTEQFHAFEAFICAFVGLMHFRGQTEPRPKDFPEEEAWVEIPVL